MSESEGDSEWQQVRHYSDHLGHPVILEEYIEPDWDPEPTHQVPIQVYSTIYSYCPPDSFACIEHHRREIAYRKQQHQAGAPNPPPLIPQFSNYGRLPRGCCVLLHSHSYRLGHLENLHEYAEAGDSPDWLYFNRAFHNRSDIDQGHHASYKSEFPLGGFELSIQPVRNQREIGQTIMCDIFHSALVTKDNTSLEYALDQDESVPSDVSPLSEGQIRHQLDQQVLAESESDLQYLTFVPFLSHLQETKIPALLESTARPFISSLIPHLRPRTTLNLKFYIPESTSWSAILPAYHNSLSYQTTSFPIGALQTLSSQENDPPALHRIYPQAGDSRRRPDLLIRNGDESAVVLDRVNFVSHAGVFFYMTNHSHDPGWGTDAPDRPDTKIERSPGMAEVARRLAMRMVEDHQV
ncbi:hypothetical protein BDW59DRAFT_177938 [Aspergillus cavernicola]|uniref:Uncharacterized protein n=1 Tax=Aspergillus cavernicola TaxID=176166 RepID=A0ABR4HGJ5_9EURO